MDIQPLVLASIAGDALRWAIFVMVAPLILLGWYQLLKKMGSF